MIIEELVQEKDEIEKKIKILEEERDLIVHKIEEQSVLECNENKIEKIESETSNFFIQIFMGVMSILGIVSGIIYVIYSQQEGLK